MDATSRRNDGIMEKGQHIQFHNAKSTNETILWPGNNLVVGSSTVSMSM